MANIEKLGLQFDLYPCPVCDGSRFSTLARHDRHSFGLHTVGCDACGMVQTNPRPSESDIGVFYARHYHAIYQGATEPSAKYVALHGKRERLRLTSNYLIDQLRPTGSYRLLDYGCGEGSLFVSLRENGFSGDLYGIEPDGAFARFAAETGKATVVPSVSGLRDIDAAVFNHSLEHLTDPAVKLRALAPALKPDGKLYIDVPDVERYSSPKDLHIAHIAHYSRRTLARLVESAGFRVLICEAHSPPHHPPSVRLIAQRSETSAPHTVTTPSTEAESWRNLRNIERKAWLWVVPLRLFRVPLLRSIYRRAKSLVTRAPNEKAA